MAVTWPDGFEAAGTASGLKTTGQPDLAMLVVERPSVWAGVFTTNAAAAPCVQRSRALLGRPLRGVVVNSGNANACTGEEGRLAVETTARAAGEVLGCEASQILTASTGPIGVPLPVGKIVAALPALADSLASAVEPFAEAIMTTDTTVKTASAQAGDAAVVGVAKGAAMIAPNMATMLAFVATDAIVAYEPLQRVLRRAVDRSFNRICIDACESTNDAVVCMSSARTAVDEDVFAVALQAVCSSLAEQIATDAEGGTKLLRIAVEGAVDEASAVDLAKTVASSSLWRAAAHGGDPNWGRVLAALGQRDRLLDLGGITVSIGPEIMFDHGEPCGSLEAAAKILEDSSVTVSCVVGDGPGSAEVLTADLSPRYVELNAWGTT